jgi:hypothetical protein
MVTAHKSRYGMFHAKCFGSDKAFYRDPHAANLLAVFMPAANGS